MIDVKSFIKIGEYRCKIGDIQDYNYAGRVATADGTQWRIDLIRRNKVKYCYFKTEQEALEMLDYLDITFEVKKLK